MSTAAKTYIDTNRKVLLSRLNATLITGERYAGINARIHSNLNTGSHVLKIGRTDVIGVYERVDYDTLDILLQVDYLGIQPITRSLRSITLNVRGFDALSAVEYRAALMAANNALMRLIDQALMQAGALGAA